MPITLELIRDGHALIQTYSDPLTATDMNDLRKKMDHEILPTATGKLPIISDFRGASNVPSTMLMTGRSWMKQAHPNTGTIILLVHEGFIQAMAEVFSRLSGKQSFVVTTSMEAALAKVDALLAVQEISYP